MRANVLCVAFDPIRFVPQTDLVVHRMAMGAVLAVMKCAAGAAAVAEQRGELEARRAEAARLSGPDRSTALRAYSKVMNAM